MCVWIVSLGIVVAKANPVCSGRFMNPITDVCWKCIFPLRVGGLTIVPSSMPDTSPKRFPVCACRRPYIPLPVPGIPISFWEPARLIDVTRSPFCMVGLGGANLGNSLGQGKRDSKDASSFYHVHWYIYPLLHVLEVLTDFMCLESHSVDLAYLTEFDPLWKSDSKSAILNPENFFFNNPLAQGACVADCLSPNLEVKDELFWCSGCQGSMYPFTGHASGVQGGVAISSLMVSRVIAKLHRQLLCWGYSGKDALCGKYVLPIIKKSQYRTQMVFPVAESSSCKTIGQNTFFWGSRKEFPLKGEDFCYLLWRKRDCCLPIPIPVEKARSTFLWK